MLSALKIQIKREKKLYSLWTDKKCKDEHTPLIGEKDEGVEPPGTPNRPAGISDRPSTNFLSSARGGIFLISLSAVAFGISASLVSVESDIPVPVVIVVRFAGTFIISAIISIVQRTRVWDLFSVGENVKIILVRSTFGVLSFACGTYAFQNMPVGEATVIISMSPVFVAMLSVCFMGEKLKCIPCVLVISSICGVVLIVNPRNFSKNFTNLNLIASCVAIGQAVSKALSYIFLKKSNKKIYFLAMLFWYTLFGTTTASVFILIMYLYLTAAGKSTDWVVKHLDTKECIILPIIGILGFISQVTLTKGAQVINATITSLIRNADIIVTLLFQVFYSGIVPCWIQIIGIVIMVLSMVLIIVNSERERVIKENGLDIK